MSIFFTKEGQTLYPATWEYNTNLIINELIKIITDNGGKVKHKTKGFIVNRSLTRIEHETAEKIASVTARIEDGTAKNPDIAKTYVNNLKIELEGVRSIKNDPVEVEGGSYISFIYEDKYYYLQIDDNPFFDFYYIKTPIDNGTYSKDACMQSFDKSWAWDCFLATTGKRATKEDIKEAANIIFNTLTAAKDSTVRIDRHKVRVRNTYDNRYHYEYVAEKERRQAVDF